MSRKCSTCGIPLWMAFMLFGWPWQRREQRFADAADCVDLLPYKSVR
jgi:hypothetical protein